MVAHLAQQQTPAEPVRSYEVRGGGDTVLRAREWGTADGPAVLFIHGWTQSDLCWRALVSGELADRLRMVTFDLRGHGDSEKPTDSSRYTDERLWADDLAAVIAETGLERPLLVAWSYGGFVVADYVRRYGDQAIAGVNLVGGAMVMRPPAFEHFGPRLLEPAEGARAPHPAPHNPGIPRLPAPGAA